MQFHIKNEPSKRIDVTRNCSSHHEHGNNGQWTKQLVDMVFLGSSSKINEILSRLLLICQMPAAANAD